MPDPSCYRWRHSSIPKRGLGKTTYWTRPAHTFVPNGPAQMSSARSERSLQCVHGKRCKTKSSGCWQIRGVEGALAGNFGIGHPVPSWRAPGFTYLVPFRKLQVSPTSGSLASSTFHPFRAPSHAPGFISFGPPSLRALQVHLVWAPARAPGFTYFGPPSADSRFHPLRAPSSAPGFT